MPTRKNILTKLILAALFLPGLFRAQDLAVMDNNLGFNVGLNLAFGTHFQRLGVNLNFFYADNFFQANSEVRAYFNFKTLGPKLRYPELVLSQGIVFGYGNRQAIFNPFLSSVSNQTHYQNSVAYSYNAYFNRKRTTQQTGIVALQVDRISLVTENDILARPMLDRFRTAAFLVQYQYEDQFQAAVNCSMWTGKMGHKQELKHKSFYYGCYMDTVGGVYANTSHGLLSAQFRYNLGYSQNVQANLGIDAEQVRNVVQNRWIHNLHLVPKKWNKARNCHIPMLDEHNDPYLYVADQTIRKAKLYLNLFGNANVFY